MDLFCTQRGATTSKGRDNVESTMFGILANGTSSKNGHSSKSSFILPDSRTRQRKRLEPLHGVRRSKGALKETLKGQVRDFERR